MNSYNIEESLGALISKANWYMKTYFGKMIKESGLNVTIEQWVLLNMISRSPGVSQTEIANTVLKDKTNVTRMLDLLEKNGYIICKNDQQDHRIYRIYLTDNGSQILNMLYPIADHVNNTGDYKGKITRTSVPWPGVLSMISCPRCSLTISSQMDRPIPLPADDVPL